MACVFFFQAEDGIRDLVRSRGLGDVYKRQPQQLTDNTYEWDKSPSWSPDGTQIVFGSNRESEPVSYTHLTLPTSDLV